MADYEGIYYCTKCGLPKHIMRVMKQEACECGNFGFISCIDFNVNDILNKMEEDK